MPQYYIQKIPPTPPNTPINKNTKWNITLPTTQQSSKHTPSLPNLEVNTTQNLLPRYSDYTEGSFVPPKQVKDGHWKKEKTGHGIYNPTKAQIQIPERLPRLQTSFRAKLMAIHKTLKKIITTKYPNEYAHIFTNCLNYLYVINTHIKHPTHHNNHGDKTILIYMVEKLKSHTQPITIYKVKAHTNMDGNEQANILAKNGSTNIYI